jgi:hypothetical protein
VTAASGAAPRAGDPSRWTLPRLGIGRDGEWLHDGEEITHAGILRSLRDSLQVDAEGHFIAIGPARVPVEVEDAPYVAVRVEAEGDQLVLTLNDLSREPLGIDTLSFAPDGVPRCRVKGGRFRARLSRAAAYQLLERVVHDEASDTATLVVGGARHVLPALAGGPRDG